jgi:hypothetical protein
MNMERRHWNGEMQRKKVGLSGFGLAGRGDGDDFRPVHSLQQVVVKTSLVNDVFF